MKRILLGVLLAAMVLFAAGCSKKAPQTATLRLASNPTTGYSWTVSQDKERFEISESFEEEKDSQGQAGAGGTQVFTLTPKKSGRVKVAFVYKRPWEETDEDSTLTYTMKISWGKQITVESFTGNLPGTMDKLPTLPKMVIE